MMRSVVVGIVILCQTFLCAAASPVGGGWGPIHHAAHDGRADEVKRLLDAGVAIDSRTKHGWTPLHLAAQAGRLEVITLLIERGADIDATGWQGATPLYDAASRQQWEAGTLLIQAGALVDLNMAAAFGMMERLKELLEDDPKALEAADEEDDEAARHRRQELRPLHWAAMNDQREAAESLIARGASVPDAIPREGTPLHVAAKHDSLKVLSLLIESGADVNAVNGRDGLRPLHFAAHWGKLEAVRALLKAGADPAVRSRSGRTAAELAQARKHEAIASLLRGETPLD